MLLTCPELFFFIAPVVRGWAHRPRDWHMVLTSAPLPTVAGNYLFTKLYRLWAHALLLSTVEQWVLGGCHSWIVSNTHLSVDRLYAELHNLYSYTHYITVLCILHVHNIIQCTLGVPKLCSTSSHVVYPLPSYLRQWAEAQTSVPYASPWADEPSL